MKKTHTPSFILELEISFSDNLLNEVYPVSHKGEPFFRCTPGPAFLDKKFRAANRIYNTALSEALRRMHLLTHDREYQEARQEYKHQKQKGELVLSSVTDAMDRAKYRCGFTEYDLHAYVCSFPKQHFHDALGADECQKLATRAYQAVCKVLSGQAKQVTFHPYDQDTSIEGKSSRSTIKYAGHQCIQVGKGKVYPLIVKKNDTYAKEALTRKVKYVRILKKTIRGRVRYYAQLVLEGIPPKTKNLSYGRKNARVGLDEGVSTLAVASDKEVSLYELAPGTTLDEKQLRVLNRAIDRSRRASNPEFYHEDGTIKKRCHKWKYTKRCRKLLRKRMELYRKSAWNRKCSHNRLANHIVSLGCEIYVEDMRIRALAKRSKAATRNKQNGKFRSRKRYGKTILSRAPASLIQAIDRKLSYLGMHIRKVNTFQVKASQYDHKSDTYKKKSILERWAYLGPEKEKVQRDLYSAFITQNVTDDLSTADRKRCCRKYRNFKQLHDLEIETLQKNCSHTLRWYIA